MEGIFMGDKEIKEIKDYINSDNVIFDVKFGIKKDDQFGNFYRIAQLWDSLCADSFILNKLSKLVNDLRHHIDSSSKYGLFIMPDLDNDCTNIYLTDVDRIIKAKELINRMNNEKCNICSNGTLIIAFENNKIVLKCKDCNSIINYVE